MGEKFHPELDARYRFVMDCQKFRIRVQIAKNKRLGHVATPRKVQGAPVQITLSLMKRIGKTN